MTSEDKYLVTRGWPDRSGCLAFITEHNGITDDIGRAKVHTKEEALCLQYSQPSLYKAYPLAFLIDNARHTVNAKGLPAKLREYTNEQG